MNGKTQVQRLDVVRTVADLRARVDAWRQVGETVALVPTMGALHEGHLSLLRRARMVAGRTCVSLFVNPAQFGPNEDFDRYPRDEAGDTAKLSEAGTDLLYTPDVAEMYPEGCVTRIAVPGLGDVLEGEFRPGFFTGVATVVAKLLLQGAPDVVVFGEKDYQQLQVVRRMVRDLDMSVRVEGVPTWREADGLALSSRNAYLTPDERVAAPALYRAITDVAARVAAGDDAASVTRVAGDDLLAAGFARVDYITVRDGDNLEAWAGPPRSGRVLAAAWLGRTRLIDNVAVPATWE